MTRALSPDVMMRVVASSSLEYKLTDAHTFGLTSASDLQRAICRVADGLPLDGLEKAATVRAAFGDVRSLPTTKCRELYLLSGIRTGKSLLAACAAFHMAVTCDVSTLRQGEIPRVSVVSLKKDLADVILNHLVGSIKASRLLSMFLVGEPSSEGIVLRHPSGVPIEVCVVAGSRAGSSLVARWSAGCIFDEFPRMVGGDEGVVNFDDMRQAVLLRFLKGCQLWGIGSPWAPFGPAFEIATEHHGKPTEARVVVKAPAPAMNPVYWTPERVAEARAADPNAAKTDVDAEFATPEEAMFSSEGITAAVRKTMFVERAPGQSYVATMDPATRGNGWTFAITTKEPSGKLVVAYAYEWTGTRDEPLDPGAVLDEAAEICGRYGVTTVHSDQAMGDALVKLARDRGLNLVQWTFTEKQRARKFLDIRTQVDLGNVELPPIAQLATDMKRVRKRVLATGIGVSLPLTTDGRHCDWAPTLMLGLSHYLETPSGPTTAKVEDPETVRMRQFVLDKFKKKGSW